MAIQRAGNSDNPWHTPVPSFALSPPQGAFLVCRTKTDRPELWLWSDIQALLFVNCNHRRAIHISGALGMAIIVSYKETE
jgi:alpha-ketoglutarate-dependent taurine dioxygenase